MKNEKTREEIVAEREAKKKAKIMAKKKLNATVTTTPLEETKPLPTVSLGTAPKETQSQQIQGSSSVAGSKSKKNEGRKGKKSETDFGDRNSKTDSPKATVTPNCPPTQKMPKIPDKIEPIAQTNQHTPVSAAKESVDGKPVEGRGDNKKNDSNVVAEDQKQTANMTKAELKAARRLKQEMQRAAKSSQPVVKTQKPAVESQPARQAQDKTQDKKTSIAKVPTKTGAPKPKPAVHKVKLFNHLYYDERTVAVGDSPSHLHPAIIGLGVQYAGGVIVGSNARCFALMNALKRVIEDYTTPQEKEFARGLESYLQPCLAYLHRCRPLAVSMTNATKHLKWQMTQLPNDVGDAEAKRKLREAIDTYLREQIDVAAQAICISVRKKISDGDVILTYGCSSLVQRILIEAHEKGTKFRAVVVDARPLREGLQLLHRLTQHGIRCSYVLVGAASCMMREATKVLLGAHALLANGYVMSRAGSSQVALLAHSYNVPVLVCCETYKFCERVQTDALVHNEIGDPEALVRDVNGPMVDWRNIANLTPLNLAYDVTPPDLVTAVVTELAILPCTSVPVILRIKPTDSHH